MSITYYIAFNKPLQKTEYKYNQIFEDKWTLFTENDKISFKTRISPEHTKDVDNLFEQRYVYQLVSNLSFDFDPSWQNNIADGYYEHQKLQLIWFKQFLLTKLKNNDEILLIRACLGEKLNSFGITSEQIKTAEWNVENLDTFSFDPDNLYQFV